MDSLQFAFWLRGYFEINGETALTKEQSEVISKHLTLVFEQRAINLPPISQPFTVTPRDTVTSPGTAPSDWPTMPGVTITCATEPVISEEGWEDVAAVRKFMDSCELPIPVTTGSTTTDLVEDYIKAMDKVRATNTGPLCTTVSCMSARYC